MKKKISSLILVICMVVALLPANIFAANDTIVLHVSANAKTGGNGSATNPYKSIEDARIALRDMNHKKKTVEVLIHGGEYKFTKTIKFDEKDSGSEGNPVIYKAAGDGDVVFTGSVKLDLTKFEMITDKAISNRLASIARGKVAQMPLEEYGITSSMLLSKPASGGAAPKRPILYFNGMMQEISKYPNTGYLIAETVINSEEGEMGGPVFQYDTIAPERWKQAKYAMVSGYMGTEYDYQYATIGKVDTDSKTIYLSTKPSYGFKSGHRWHAQNLLEEIDTPGEYYLDPDTLMLYYYPTRKFNANDVLELSVLDANFINLTSVNYVQFHGIDFQHNLENGVKLSKSNNIVFRNCSFINIGLIGIDVSGKNNLVEACTFRETGTHAVRTYSCSDHKIYERSENRIANCHFWNCAWLASSGKQRYISLGREMSSSTGAVIGDIVENCLFHGQPKSGAIIYGGMENIIRYNEMWEMQRECADAGVIYCGRRLSEWGNLQEYNYIHDFGSLFSAQYTVVGIYWDDYQSGQTSKHNIIVANNKNKTSGDLDVGSYNVNTENIYAHLNTGVAHSDRNAVTHSTAYGSLTNYRSPQAVHDKWPQMMELKKLIDAGTVFPVVNNVVKDNLNVDVNQTNVKKIMDKGNNVVENNPITDDYSVFVDYKNHDWRLTTAAMEKFGFPETFINEKNFSMDRIGIQKDVFDVQTPNAETSPFRLLYPQNGQNNVSRNGAFIKWEKALYSDQFDYVVATDPELKNVVEKGTTYYNSAELYNLENGKTYYYKVWAKNLSKQIGNTWESEGVPYMFKTSQYDDLEKGFLNEEIAKLEKLAASIVPGNNVGDYTSEAKVKADALLSEAKEMALLSKGDQSLVDEMTVKVRNFVATADGYRYNGHAATPVNGEWGANANASVEKTDGGVKITAAAKGAMAWPSQKLSNSAIQHFKMKADSPSWFGISLRQENTEKNPYDKNSGNYLVVIKPDLFEFQKFSVQAPQTGIIATYPNTVVKNGEWNDYEFGAVSVPGGVEVSLKVNGQLIFKYYDNQKPITTPGYFTIFQNEAGGNVEFKMAENVPAEFYEFSLEEALATQNETIYNEKSDNFVAEGTWASGSKIGPNKAAIYTSKENGSAKATYKITDTLVSYNISYYHSPYAKGDKAENVKITFYTATAAGDITINKKIDFTSGEAGWVDLGSFQCASAGQTGRIEVEFSGSGEGEIVAPAIRARVVEGDEFEFSRLFYDFSENLLMMQINNQKAFNMMSPVQIPDVAPMIDGGRTMVPLRFVSEAFGADVSWNGDTREVTIVNGDTTLVFAIDNATYTVNGEARQSDVPAKIVNGRTMVPLRVTAESLGKKVFWNGTHSMIFIADSFAFAETETDKFDLAAKGFKGFN